MIISGLLIQYERGKQERVATAVRAFPGISDLTLLESSDRMACVLESAAPEASAATVKQLSQIPGVYSVLPTYIHEIEEA